MNKKAWVMWNRILLVRKLEKAAKELITVMAADIEMELERIAEEASSDNACW